MAGKGLGLEARKLLFSMFTVCEEPSFTVTLISRSRKLISGQVAGSEHRVRWFNVPEAART
jgi:hypothetical protein